MNSEYSNRNAYMTLEAALVMPIVLYSCFLLIYLGFFMHDRCLVTQDCYRIALYGSSAYKDQSQIAFNAAESYRDKIVGQKYINHKCQFQIIVSNNVEVNGSGTLKIDIPMVRLLCGKEYLDIKSSKHSVCRNPVVMIRLLKQVLDRGDTRRE